jgi:hypothetical protein
VGDGGTVREAEVEEGGGVMRRHALRLGTRWRRAQRLGTRRRRAPGPGSRTVGGGAATVAGVTEEREHLVVSKNC